MNSVIVICCISFFLSLAIGVLIYFKKDFLFKDDKNSNRVSIANVAAAGVLIAMALHHILCEALIELLKMLGDSIESLRLFKMATMVFFMGFLFMFICEKLLIKHNHDEAIEKTIKPLQNKTSRKNGAMSDPYAGGTSNKKDDDDASMSHSLISSNLHKKKKKKKGKQ